MELGMSSAEGKDVYQIPVVHPKQLKPSLGVYIVNHCQIICTKPMVTVHELETRECPLSIDDFSARSAE